KFENFKYDIKEEPFNFARSVNRGIELSGNNDVMLLNNDIEIISSNWLTEMVSCLKFENTGVVGAKLIYKDGTIQHAGVIAGLGGYAGHWFSNEPASSGGLMNRLHVRNSLTSVTGAAMLISRQCLDNVGNFDESNFAIAYNDVDFCLRAHKAGYRIVWTPFAELYHLESATRGSDETEQNRERFEMEKSNLQNLHDTQNMVDPALHPYLSRSHASPFSKYTKFVRGGRTWMKMN
ncbi:MAG: glycosyltransferase, partial [Pseudomonadota bacterium]